MWLACNNIPFITATCYWPNHQFPNIPMSSLLKVIGMWSPLLHLNLATQVQIFSCIFYCMLCETWYGSLINFKRVKSWVKTVLNNMSIRMLVVPSMLSFVHQYPHVYVYLYCETNSVQLYQFISGNMIHKLWIALESMLPFKSWMFVKLRFIVYQNCHANNIISSID